MTTAIRMTGNAERVSRATLKVARESKPARVTEAVVVDAKTVPAAVLNTLKLMRERKCAVCATTILSSTDVNFTCFSCPTEIANARIVSAHPVTQTIGETGRIHDGRTFKTINTVIIRIAKTRSIHTGASARTIVCA
jgi:hypothetical protein